MKTFKIVLYTLILLLIVGCKTANDVNKQTIIRERIVDNSFDIGGTAKQDTIRKELFLWDTIIKRFNKIDTIKTTFNELTKLQSLKLIATPDTIRDTTIIQETNNIRYIDIVPKWAYWCLCIVMCEFVFIIAYIMYKNKIWIFK